MSEFVALSYNPSSGNLLHLAGLLRRRYARPPRFNLFTTLRSGSDEVRLHSRFLAALINPQSHELGVKPLRYFLDRVGVKNFSLEGVCVECERFNIDILVTNNRRQALVVENKIYASDQPGQLQRYYKTMHSRKYSEIHMRYLTLDGRDPSDDSLGDLAGLGSMGRPGSYACASYHETLMPWLQECLGDAALDPPLRESIAQYYDLVSKLTGNDMSDDHLATLTDTLLQGDNLLAAHDIKLAYDEALIRLQMTLWQELKEGVKSRCNKMADCLTHESCTEMDLEGLCRSFVYKSRNNRWYGLYYRLPGYSDAYACFDIDQSIYLGVYCSKVDNAVEYDRIIEALRESDYDEEAANCNDWWPFFKFTSQTVMLKSPSVEELQRLSDSRWRQGYVQAMVDELVGLWELVTKSTTPSTP